MYPQTALQVWLYCSANILQWYREILLGWFIS